MGSSVGQPTSDSTIPSRPVAPRRPITVLTAWRRGSASNAGSPSLCTAPDILWLTPHVTAPNRLLPALRQHRPDVLLLGQDIYDELGAEPLSQLRTQFAGLHILLVAQAPTPELYDEVLRCRFRGVLPANCPPGACPNAVRAICQGEIWLPRASLSKLAARAMDTRVFGQTLPPHAPARATKAPKVLSRREKEIVELVRHGLTNKEIARQLDIMEDTVKKHLQNVFSKLGVRRRTLVALNGCRPPDRRGRANGAAVISRGGDRKGVG